MQLRLVKKRTMWRLGLIACSWILFLSSSCQTTAAACLTTLNELNESEKAVVDVSVRRTYTLCSNTRFVVGRYDYSYRLVDGQDPLIVRPNLHVKCGENASRSNQCLLVTGDVLVKDIATSLAGTGTIVLEGLTMVDPGRHFVKLVQPNTVHFVDCEFRQAKRAWVPLLLDFYNPNQIQQQLSVYWHRCDFVDNTFRGALAQPSLIAGTNLQVTLSLHGCHFTSNDFVTNNTISDRNSFLIDTNGPLELVRNCFSWNAVGVSPAVSYHADNAAVQVTDNFAEVSRGGICPFVAHFRTAWQFQTESPYCYDFDVQTCRADATSDYWTVAPTPAPSSSSSLTTVPPSIAMPVVQTSTPTQIQLTLNPTRTSQVVTTTGNPTLAPATRFKPSSSIPTALPRGTPYPTPQSNVFTPTQPASSASITLSTYTLIVVSFLVVRSFF